MPGNMVGKDQKDSYVDEEVRSKRGVLTSKYPDEHADSGIHKISEPIASHSKEQVNSFWGPRMTHLIFYGCWGFNPFGKMWSNPSFQLGRTRTSQVTIAVQAQTSENLADECLHFNSLSLEAELVATIAGQVLGPSHSFESSLQAAETTPEKESIAWSSWSLVWGALRVISPSIVGGCNMPGNMVGMDQKDSNYDFSLLSWDLDIDPIIDEV